MSDPLYGKPLLRLAADAVGAGHLPHPDATGMAHNPTCGDRVSVELTLDDNGRITRLAHETKACVLAQASASILGKHLPGADTARVRGLRDQVSSMLEDGNAPPSPFTDYDTLKPAAEFRNRHTCVLLPIDAVLAALGDASPLKAMLFEELQSLFPGRPHDIEYAGFRTEDVPEGLRSLIPYAHMWGIADDGYRHELVKATPPNLLSHVRRIVLARDEGLTQWLAGPGANLDTPTDAYVAFSALLQLADAS